MSAVKWREIAMGIRERMREADACIVDMAGASFVVPKGMALWGPGPMIDMPVASAKRIQKWMFQVKDHALWSVDGAVVWAARVGGSVSVGLAQCVADDGRIPQDLRLTEVA